MSALSFVDSYKCRLLNDIRRVDKIRTPIIGIVRGYALGGGCELRLEDHVFKKPEGLIVYFCIGQNVTTQWVDRMAETEHRGPENLRKLQY